MSNKNSNNNTTISAIRVKYNSKINGWEQESIVADRKDFINLKNAVKATLESPKGLTRKDSAFATDEAWTVYAWVIDHLYTNLSLYVQAAKRHDETSAKAALDRAFINLKDYLSMFDAEWVGDQLWIDAMLPHVGTYRKDASGEYVFRASADSGTFRKQLERTVANRMGEGSILTHDRLREMRKARELAKRAERKAAREAAAKA